MNKRQRSKDNWERYQKALTRKRFRGSTPTRTQPSKQHEHGICERKECRNPATKSIYGLGYIAGVCQEHYDAATWKERANAVRFKYAER